MFLTGVISYLCSCRGIIKHASTKTVVSADFLAHADTSPAANVKCELLNRVGGRGVSHGSWAVLHRSLASGTRQVKHNKLQLSQTWGIIYLNPAQSVWLHFSNTLHYPAPVAPQCPTMSVPITPASLVSALCRRESKKDRFNWAFHICLLFPPFHLCSCTNTVYYVLFFKKSVAVGTWRDSVKSQVALSLMKPLFAIFE